MSSINIKRCFTILLSLLMLTAVCLFLSPPTAQAEPDRGDHREGVKQAPSRSAPRQAPAARMVTPRGAPARMESSRKAPARTAFPGQPSMRSESRKMAPSGRQTPPSGQFVDSRYQHNHSYPTRGQSFRTLPKDYRVSMYDHTRYYHSHGVWYRHYGGSYIVVAPPFGLFVPFLPFVYTTIWVGGMPYYYANDTYYAQAPGGYVVVEPPQGSVSEEPPPEAEENIDQDQLFIYPNKGQSEDQQAKDRYECYKWATEQTNYDPTQIPSPVPADQLPGVRDNYKRAFATCLEAHGYTVR